LAAWASWQRALRVDPESVVAKKALATLESAGDLPAAAKTVYRFREPRDAARRAAWNQALRDRNAEDPAIAADLFGTLVNQDPADSAAWFNRALCLAWIGRNAEAIGCLERVVGLDAEPAFDRAVDAWTLTEVLRQGGGAETLADDLRYACTIPWQPSDTPPLLDEFPEIQKRPAPKLPGEADETAPSIEIYEWFDRLPATAADVGRPPESRPADSPAIVVATVFISPSSLRLSSPRADGLDEVVEKLTAIAEIPADSIERQASPLPLAFLDADVWAFRIPAGVGAKVEHSLTRDAIEHYFENQWIHRPRHGLERATPLEAADKARRGDAAVRAKLTAVVRVREQLGSRPSALRLYQGYPFDRLRRRLGLEPIESAAVDPQDLAAAAPAELGQLAPAALDDVRLVQAAQSAAGLRDDESTVRFATELLRRQSASVGPGTIEGVSALIRHAINRSEYDQALAWIDNAQRMTGNRETATTLEIWRAEILARAGRADQALGVYLRLIDPESASGARLALDAAETMLDNGHFAAADSLLILARDVARRWQRPWSQRRAQRLLDFGRI
jgi:tetratricopeptide (TPR) repeat protein